MKVIMVYSEAGGVTKTTTAVSLAMVSAAAGNSTTLIDLDPRGAATKWVGSYPDESWKHVGAIL
ncbi:MAG: ParA family protein, partial [Rhodococcus sp. (in: high G+C Gram-positive bacteria)]|nr:ParA family protein [Rhodococcus sp. (in: high G+C Gram-positive bacteria)]